MRLRQGNLAQETVYSDNPAEVAARWLSQGARRLHVVDLDGADRGTQHNEKAVRAILTKVGDKMEVQVGGGLRTMDALEEYFNLGISYAVLGTAAIRNPGFLVNACTAYEGRIIVALDARHSKIAVAGWTEQTNLEVLEVAKRCEHNGACAILYTDIQRDGMMQGVNFEATVALAQELVVPVIASGGVTTLDDVRALCAHERDGIRGAVVGRALYEGKIDLAEALAVCENFPATQPSTTVP